MPHCVLLAVSSLYLNTFHEKYHQLPFCVKDRKRRKIIRLNDKLEEEENENTVAPFRSMTKCFFLSGNARKVCFEIYLRILIVRNVFVDLSKLL